MRAAASLLVLVLAGPAAAESPAPIAPGLTDLLAGFASDDPQEVLAAGLAACLAGKGDGAATAALFEQAGWTRQDQPEMGSIDLAATTGDLTAMVWDASGFCMVASESIGTGTARDILAHVATAGGFDPQPVTEDSDCPQIDIEPGLRVEITSGGNDPVCDWDDDSAVRFGWSAG